VNEQKKPKKEKEGDIVKDDIIQDYDSVLKEIIQTNNYTFLLFVHLLLLLQSLDMQF
jgi:hypothetical protein